MGVWQEYYWVGVELVAPGPGLAWQARCCQASVWRITLNLHEPNPAYVAAWRRVGLEPLILQMNAQTGAVHSVEHAETRAPVHMDLRVALALFNYVHPLRVPAICARRTRLNDEQRRIIAHHRDEAVRLQRDRASFVVVAVEDGCYESWPCQHRCTVRYEDGSKDTRLLASSAIEKLWAGPWEHKPVYSHAT